MDETDHHSSDSDMNESMANSSVNPVVVPNNDDSSDILMDEASQGQNGHVTENDSGFPDAEIGTDVSTSPANESTETINSWENSQSSSYEMYRFYGNTPNPPRFSFSEQDVFQTEDLISWNAALRAEAMTQFEAVHFPLHIDDYRDPNYEARITQEIRGTHYIMNYIRIDNGGRAGMEIPISTFGRLVHFGITEDEFLQCDAYTNQKIRPVTVNGIHFLYEPHQDIFIPDHLEWKMHGSLSDCTELFLLSPRNAEGPW